MPRYAVLLLLLVTPQILCGDDERASDPPVATGRFVYKQEPRRTLTVYYPDDWKADDRRPTLIIFRCNIPYQREHFRKLGMVVIEPQLAAANSGRLPSLSLEEIAKQPKPRDLVADIPYVLPYQAPPALSPVAKPAKRRDGLFVCGDYLDTASIQGAMLSGRRAAECAMRSLLLN